jgi:hypothetical protein
MKYIVNILLVVLIATFVSAPLMAQTITSTPFFPVWQMCVQYHNAHPDASGYVPVSGAPVQPTDQQTLGSLPADMAGCYPTNLPSSGWVLRTAGDPTITKEGVVVRDPRNGAQFGQPVLFKNLATPVVANNCPDLTSRQMPTPASGMLRTQVVHKTSDCGGVSSTVDDTQQTVSDAKRDIELAKIKAKVEIAKAKAEAKAKKSACGAVCRFFLEPAIVPVGYVYGGGYNTYGYYGYNNYNYGGGYRRGERSIVPPSRSPAGTPPTGTTGPVAPSGGTGGVHFSR